MNPADFFSLQAVDNRGKTFDFAALKGRPVLVVNTASKCGLTPQYQGLQALYSEFHPQGLEIIGFPCDQFAHQEPGDDGEIAQFCSLNYGVTFPLMRKVEVNGPGQSPVFAWLKNTSAGLWQRLSGTDIRWNFTKFLVWPDGRRVERFAPTTVPTAMRSAITKALGQVK